MRSTSPVLPGLARSLASNAIISPEDANLTIPPLVLPVARVPLPMEHLIASAPPNLKSGSGVVFQEPQMLANSNEEFLRLVEGLWEIDVTHWVVSIGVVASSAAYGEILIQTQQGFASRLSKLRATTGQPGISRRFPLTVPKDNYVSFFHSISIGPGLVEWRSCVSIVFNRIL